MYNCKITPVKKGESVKYGVAYTFYTSQNAIGRAVFTRKIAGKWKGWFLLSNVVVYSKFRGKGLCSKMLRCMLRCYSDKKVFLEVKKVNIAAIKCYEKCGFKVKSGGEKEGKKSDFVMIKV